MFNIDFTGGDLLVLHSQKELTESDVRAQLSSIGLGEVTIQREVGQKDGKQAPFLSIRAPFNSNQKIVDQLKSAYPDANIVVDQAEAVGPIVGSQLAITSLWALAIGTLGIFVYVMFRFELSFAVGVIFSVIYDVLLTLGLFILSGRDMSLIMVGAILTVSGYSLNDKIVVFDRIREYFRSGKKGSIQTLMNQAINETLSRTVLTAGVTLLSMIGLYFLGGEVLADFAFTIFFGILIGTFSSIFIASPIVLWWTRMRKRDLHEEVRAGEAERQRARTAQPSASRPSA
jgi:SecD/SecF fusion protein